MWIFHPPRRLDFQTQEGRTRANIFQAVEKVVGVVLYDYALAAAMQSSGICNDGIVSCFKAPPNFAFLFHDQQQKVSNVEPGYSLLI